MCTIRCIVASCQVSYLTKEQIVNRRECRFPKNEKLLEAWCDALQMKCLSKLSQSELLKKRICSLHFEDKYFSPNSNCRNKLSMLRKDAVPSLMLREEDFIFPENNRCCIPGCDEYQWQEKRRFVTFPRNETILAKWVQAVPALQNVCPKKIYSKFKICNMHFPEESRNAFYDQPAVVRGAVPSLFLTIEDGYFVIQSQEQLFSEENFAHLENTVSLNEQHISCETIPLENELQEITVDQKMVPVRTVSVQTASENKCGGKYF